MQQGDRFRGARRAGFWHVLKRGCLDAGIGLLLLLVSAQPVLDRPVAVVDFAKLVCIGQAAADERE